MSMRLFVMLAWLLMLTGCSAEREFSQAELEQRRAVWEAFNSDERTARAIMWADKFEEGAQLYVSLWERATSPPLNERTYESSCVACDMRVWQRKLPWLRERWQHLVPPMEARVARNDVTPLAVMQFLSLLDAIDDLEPLVRQVEALEDHPKRRAAWCTDRDVSNLAKELLLRAEQPGLVGMIARNPLQQVGDAISDVVAGVGEEISARTLGRRMPK